MFPVMTDGVSLTQNPNLAALETVTTTENGIRALGDDQRALRRRRPERRLRSARRVGGALSDGVRTLAAQQRRTAAAGRVRLAVFVWRSRSRRPRLRRRRPRRRRAARRCCAAPSARSAPSSRASWTSARSTSTATARRSPSSAISPATRRAPGETLADRLGGDGARSTGALRDRRARAGRARAAARLLAVAPALSEGRRARGRRARRRLPARSRRRHDREPRALSCASTRPSARRRRASRRSRASSRRRRTRSRTAPCKRLADDPGTRLEAAPAGRRGARSGDRERGARPQALRRDLLRLAAAHRLDGMRESIARVAESRPAAGGRSLGRARRDRRRAAASRRCTACSARPIPACAPSPRVTRPARAEAARALALARQRSGARGAHRGRRERSSRTGGNDALEVGLRRALRPRARRARGRRAGGGRARRRRRAAPARARARPARVATRTVPSAPSPSPAPRDRASCSSCRRPIPTPTTRGQARTAARSRSQEALTRYSRRRSQTT